jgi:hypothetical protein
VEVRRLRNRVEGAARATAPGPDGHVAPVAVSLDPQALPRPARPQSHAMALAWIWEANSPPHRIGSDDGDGLHPLSLARGLVMLRELRRRRAPLAW